MAKRPPPKRLFKDQDRVSSYQHNQSPTKLMKRVSRDHEDVLRGIETCLVKRARQDPSMDDQAAFEAVNACRLGTAPPDGLVGELVHGLTAAREALAVGVSDEVWKDALKVVGDSVKRHSRFAPRERSYLGFAAQFL